MFAILFGAHLTTQSTDSGILVPEGGGCEFRGLAMLDPLLGMIWRVIRDQTFDDEAHLTEYVLSLTKLEFLPMNFH